jgi:hypothetical protein
MGTLIITALGDIYGINSDEKFSLAIFVRKIFRCVVGKFFGEEKIFVSVVAEIYS